MEELPEEILAFAAGIVDIARNELPYELSPNQPVALALTLQNRGCDVDFFLPWGLPHGGDYDLEELFAWIDGICR